jgi:hypothetical protein
VIPGPPAAPATPAEPSHAAALDSIWATPPAEQTPPPEPLWGVQSDSLPAWIGSHADAPAPPESEPRPESQSLQWNETAAAGSPGTPAAEQPADERTADPKQHAEASKEPAKSEKDQKDQSGGFRLPSWLDL